MSVEVAARKALSATYRVTLVCGADGCFRLPHPLEYDLMNSTKWTYLYLILATLLHVHSSLAVEVEFGEVDLPSLTRLDDTSFFDSFGISFEDETFYAVTDNFVGAGIDDRGITGNTGSNNLIAVVFDPPVNSLTVDFLTLGDAAATGAARDANGTLIERFIFAEGFLEPAYGSHTFENPGDITTFSFRSDQIHNVGLGRLDFTPVPEPSGCIAYFLALCVALSYRRSALAKAA